MRGELCQRCGHPMAAHQPAACASCAHEESAGTRSVNDVCRPSVGAQQRRAAASQVPWELRKEPGWARWASWAAGVSVAALWGILTFVPAFPAPLGLAIAVLGLIFAAIWVFYAGRELALSAGLAIRNAFDAWEGRRLRK
ncbi:hypothetical protein [Phycicoccus avicenniae]|uniref:hypothetical protein n=1 Tax=Phycicoccus avicenniae TaxID=2828860 RepID=UPI003D2D9E04